MTTPEFTANPDNFCYRHPDRQSFVLCQRCMRTICPQCQTQAPVGVICPECMKEQRRNESPAQRKARRRWTSGPVAVADGRPMATYVIIAITAFVSLLQMIPGIGDTITHQLLFNITYVLPQAGYPFEPWRMLTTALVHSGFIHLGLNMLALWMIGRVLEPLIGRGRFVALYVISAFGGSVAVAAIPPFASTVGASGAVFGLMAAFFVIARHLGADVAGILVVLGINLVISFVFPGIAWQAHIGGLVAGALVGLVYIATRQRSQRVVRILLLTAIVVGLALVVVVVPPLIALR